MPSRRDRGRVTRRTFLAGLAASPALALPPAQSPTWWLPDLRREEARVRAELKRAKGTKLVLLGTHGGPSPGHIRHNSANVIVHKGAAYVLDCGLGVTNQFARTGLKFGSVRSIFITHHHPDHNIEYGPFLVIGWIYGLSPSVTAYGPPPLVQMTRDFLRSQTATIEFWAEDFQIEPLRAIEAHNLPQPGHVMQDENVRVTSVLVQHPPVKPAYGYRFDFPDRSIAFSGDTVPLEAVAKMARGADVLVHEAMILPAIREEMQRTMEHASPSGGFRAASFETVMRHMVADHSPAEAVGRIAHQAGVKTLVLTHLVPAWTSIADAAWRRLAAGHFHGEIIVGHDLLVV